MNLEEWKQNIRELDKELGTDESDELDMCRCILSDWEKDKQQRRLYWW